MNIKFIYLTAFSKVGGIEKFNRAFLKATYDLGRSNGYNVDAISLYDDKVDDRYFPSNKIKCFNKNLIAFILFSIISSRRTDIIFLGHVNLSLVGLAIKIFNPNVKLYAIAHGIEVWDKLTYFQKKCLNTSNKILSVSNFTKNKLVKIHNIDPNKVIIFPNTLDPFFKSNISKEKPVHLLKKLKIEKDTKVLLTVSRIQKTEIDKGYDKVIKVLPNLIKNYPKIKYLLVGKSDKEEASRLNFIIKELNLNNNVHILDNINDLEIVDYYSLADLFILPSKKEGFGIVFLEALAAGKPVIAGNCDGSKEPLNNGKLGILVNPDDQKEIENAINNLLIKNVQLQLKDHEYLSDTVIKQFGFEKFKENLTNLLLN